MQLTMINQVKAPDHLKKKIELDAMSLQEAKGRESSAPPPPRYLHAIKEAISGRSGAAGW